MIKTWTTNRPFSLFPVSYLLSTVPNPLELTLLWNFYYNNNNNNNNTRTHIGTYTHKRTSFTNDKTPTNKQLQFFLKLFFPQCTLHVGISCPPFFTSFMYMCLKQRMRWKIPINPQDKQLQMKICVCNKQFSFKQCNQEQMWKNRSHNCHLCHPY